MRVVRKLLLALVGVVAALAIWDEVAARDRAPAPPAASPRAESVDRAGEEREAGEEVDRGDALLAELYAERRSNVWVTARGTVARLLPDDRRGSPHQRFLVELGNGQTLLVAHNLELASRVPLAVGEAIEVRGEYEWNGRGGVLHWTHDDPDGRRGGGWIRHRGVVHR